MMITMKSQMSGVTRTVDINMTQDQYDHWLYGTDLIQDALPHLSDSDREFLMTGIVDEEWDDIMGDYDEDGWDHEDDYEDDPSEDDMLYEDRMSLRDQQINDRLDMGRNEAGEWLGWTT
jgi:hypothetical protein